MFSDSGAAGKKIKSVLVNVKRGRAYSGTRGPDLGLTEVQALRTKFTTAKSLKRSRSAFPEQQNSQPAGMLVCLAAESRHDNILRSLTSDGFKMAAVTRAGAGLAEARQ